MIATGATMFCIIDTVNGHYIRIYVPIYILNLRTAAIPNFTDTSSMYNQFILHQLQKWNDHHNALWLIHSYIRFYY